MSTLSERINKAMLDVGISQSDLATACKIKSPSVNDWLSGKTKSLKASTATRAAAALGVSVEWLSEGRGKMHQGDTQNFTQAPDVRDYVPLTVSGLLEDLRGKISEQPEPVRAAIANLVTGYVMSPTPEEGKAVADMIERMLSNK